MAPTSPTTSPAQPSTCSPTQGYANTSVQQIVEAAGVTKGAMYHYFESKDDLLFSIYERMLSLQKAHLDEISAAADRATTSCAPCAST